MSDEGAPINTFKNTMIGTLCLFTDELLWSVVSLMTKLANTTFPISQYLYGRFGIPLIIGTISWIIRRPNNVNNWYGDYPYIKNI